MAEERRRRRPCGDRRPRRRARPGARGAARLPLRARARRSPAALLETAFADLEASLRPRDDAARSRHRRSSRAAAERASTLVDMVRTLAQRERTRIATPTWSTGSRPRAARIDSWRSDLLARDPAGFIVEHLETLANIALELAAAMEFGFLLDAQRKLLSIGYRATDGTLDDSCYDLLASEARLASFVAIAKGDIPARHWFRLGRTVTPIGAGAALVSWSGSMFEYLMPDLVLRAPGGSLLAQTSRLIVQAADRLRRGARPALGRFRVRVQRARSRAHLSVFELRRAGPGTQARPVREQGDRALRHRPRRHDRRRSRAGQLHRAGRSSARAAAIGFYEAVDFTAEPRARRRNARAGARLHGASPGHEHRRHRQCAARWPHARSLPFRRRRCRPPNCCCRNARRAMCRWRIRAPRKSGTAARVADPQVPRGAAPPQPARLGAADPPAVERPLLGHGHRGRLRLQPLERSRRHALARRCDARRHRQLSSCCATWRPAACGRRATSPRAGQPGSYDVSFTEDRAEIIRTDGDLVTHARDRRCLPKTMPKCAACRSATRSLRAREIEVTSYAELVLGAQAADVAHPAFSKMFVRTEFLARQSAVARQPPAPRARRTGSLGLASRRGRRRRRRRGPEFETDRATLHRPRPRAARTARHARRPRAVGHRRHGARRGVRAALSHARARRRHGAHRVLDLRRRRPRAAARHRRQASRPQCAHARRHAGLDPGAGAAAPPRHRRLAGQPVPAARRPHPVRRAPRRAPRPTTSGAARPDPPALWAQGISGDLPIVLLRVEDMRRSRRGAPAAAGARILGHQAPVGGPGDPQRARRLLRPGSAGGASNRWCAPASRARASPARTRAARCSCCAPTSSPPETRALLLAVARVVLSGRRGSLADQVERMQPTPAAGAAPAATRAGRDVAGGRSRKPRASWSSSTASAASPRRAANTCITRARRAEHARAVDQRDRESRLRFPGGQRWRRLHLGAQQPRERAHALVERSGHQPPGRGYLPARRGNAASCGRPTPAPIRLEDAHYSCAHGIGYSRFEQRSHGISLELTMFVPLEDPDQDLPAARAQRFAAPAQHLGHRVRRVGARAVAHRRCAARPHRARRQHAARCSRAIPGTPRSPASRSPICAARRPNSPATAREFLGRHGTLDAPAALVSGAPLSGRTGAALDPCAALRTRLELEPVGEHRNRVPVRRGRGRRRSARADRHAIAPPTSTSCSAQVREHWDEAHGSRAGEDARPRVRHHDERLAALSDARLPHLGARRRSTRRAARTASAISCRTRWRSGSRARSCCASRSCAPPSRQFPEGDVQHWWLPHSGQGVRTHISDDRVWLSFVTAHYIALTGDRAILDVAAAVHRRPAAAARAARRVLRRPRSASDTATLFEHCRRGLEGALYMGQHGLPLIGTGDWNDGMNRVGEHGRGESVWLGWFLHATLHCVRAHRAGARRTRARHRLARPRHASCAPRSNSTPGMASGIAAASSTTARRSAPPTTTSADRRHRAVLERDLRRGESGARRARHGRARRAAAASAIRRSRCCSRRPSRSPRRSRAT